MTHRPYTPPAWQAKPLADGRVTLLVVPLKVQPDERRISDSCEIEPGVWAWRNGHDGSLEGRVNLPYAPGDLIWCREAWRNTEDFGLMYKSCSGVEFNWRSPITMPKWAARTWLRCTGVEVRRVQTISEDDAWAVGCPKGDPTDNGGWFPKEELQPDGSEMGWDCPEDWVADKWDEQYAPKPRKRAGGTIPPKTATALSWDANPWAAFVAVEKISKEDV